MTADPRDRGLRLFDKRVELASWEELKSLQWERLKAFLIEHVWPNAFHRSRWEATGLSIDDIRSPDDLKMIPLMRKEDVVRDLAANPPFGTLSRVSRGDIAQIVETTGTTGGGRELYVLDHEDDRGLVEMEAIGFHWAGVGPGSFVASTFPVTTRAAGRWYQGAVTRLSGVYLPLGTYPASAKLQYLRSLPVTLLVATPSYLGRLEAVAASEGIEPHSFGVDGLLVAGESYTADWGREREHTWGATLFEQYGSTQRAFAWSCERGALDGASPGVLHTLPHHAYYEVVDPTSGDPVAEGEAGELIITPFTASRAAPLVRFATGDRLHWLGPNACPCGRALPGIRAGAVERLDDMVKVRGVNLFPSDLDALILREPVVDYEGVISLREDGRESIRVAVETRARGEVDGPELLRRLAEDLARATGLRIDVAEHTGPPLTPETQEEMRKRRRWKDLRQQGSPARS